MYEIPKNHYRSTNVCNVKSALLQKKMIFLGGVILTQQQPTHFSGESMFLNVSFGTNGRCLNYFPVVFSIKRNTVHMHD